jgi:hypothetical protein
MDRMDGSMDRGDGSMDGWRGWINGSMDGKGRDSSGLFLFGMKKMSIGAASFLKISLCVV